MRHTTSGDGAPFYHKQPSSMRLGPGHHEIVKYKIQAADPTWPNGQVFFPKTERLGSTTGLSKTVVVAPAERIPWDSLPVQARMDTFGTGPAGNALGMVGASSAVGASAGGVKGLGAAGGSAVSGVGNVIPVSLEDAIPARYAKYLDQVHDSEQDCDNTISVPGCVRNDCPLGRGRPLRGHVVFGRRWCGMAMFLRVLVLVSLSAFYRSHEHEHLLQIVFSCHFK